MKGYPTNKPNQQKEKNRAWKRVSLCFLGRTKSTNSWSRRVWIETQWIWRYHAKLIQFCYYLEMLQIQDRNLINLVQKQFFIPVYDKSFYNKILSWSWGDEYEWLELRLIFGPYNVVLCIDLKCFHLFSWIKVSSNSNFARCNILPELTIFQENMSLKPTKHYLFHSVD